MLVENKLHREHWRLSNHPAAFIPEGRKWIKEKWGTERCVSLSLCTAFTQCCTQISRVQKYIFWKCLLLLHFQAFFNVLAEVWKIDACSYLYITYDRFLARNNLKKKKNRNAQFGESFINVLLIETHFVKAAEMSELPEV